MHVYITIILGFNRLLNRLLLQQIYYSEEEDPRIPQHIRWRSLQQLQTAKTS